MERMTLCVQCQRSFNDDEGQLHPTFDGICCPHCGALNLFVAAPPSWETYQEMLLDERWENHHHSEEDDFYAYYVE